MSHHIGFVSNLVSFTFFAFGISIRSFRSVMSFNRAVYCLPGFQLLPSVDALYSAHKYLEFPVNKKKLSFVRINMTVRICRSQMPAKCDATGGLSILKKLLTWCGYADCREVCVIWPPWLFIVHAEHASSLQIRSFPSSINCTRWYSVGIWSILIRVFIKLLWKFMNDSILSTCVALHA